MAAETGTVASFGDHEAAGDSGKGGFDGECFGVLPLEKDEEVVLEGTEVGDRRGLSDMYFAKLAREVAELAKMGLKVSRNSVYAGGGVMVTVFS